MENSRLSDRVKRSFRRGFETYSDTASVQAQVAQTLAKMIVDHSPDATFEHAFEFGCGTGNLTRSLVGQAKIDELWLNDLVPASRQVTDEAAPFVKKVQFLGGDVADLLLPRPVDLIASASTIQWIPDHAALLSHLGAFLAPGGLLAISGFGTSQYSELVKLGSVAGAPGYRDAEDWAGVLPPDLELISRAQEKAVLTFPNARAVLKHLRRTGVNGQASSNWTRRQLAAFEGEYVERFGGSDGVTLTYDPVWLLARKKA